MTASAPAARLLSIDDVVERLRIGRSKVYMEMDAGRLRSVKVGRRRLVSESAIADFIGALEGGLMSPPGPMAQSRSGVSASPTTEDLSAGAVSPPDKLGPSKPIPSDDFQCAG
jgi:excisionase family DNA binding protein